MPSKKNQSALITNNQASLNLPDQKINPSTTDISVSPPTFEGGPIVQAVKKDNTLAVFALFDAIDNGLFGSLLSITTCILLITYLVTSQDSGTHVLCFLDTHSDKETPIRIRLIWSIFITLISAGLLYIGGLKTIQTAIVLFGFPMIILLTIICITLFKALKNESITSINVVPKHPDVK